MLVAKTPHGEYSSSYHMSEAQLPELAVTPTEPTQMRTYYKGV